MSDDLTTIVMLFKCEETLKAGGYVEVHCDECDIIIQARPHYCDRGRYSVNVFSHESRRFSIDETDAFPRYFFRLENLLDELICFLEMRRLKVADVLYVNADLRPE